MKWWICLCGAIHTTETCSSPCCKKTEDPKSAPVIVPLQEMTE